MNTGRLIPLALRWLLFCVGALGAGDAAMAQGLVGREQQQAIRSSLVGEWVAGVGTERIQLRLHRDGRFALGDVEGTYGVQGKALQLRSGETTTDYQFDLTAKELTLSAGDTMDPIKFSKISGVADIGDRFSAGSARSAVKKLYRMGAILAVAVVCRIVLWLLRTLVRFVIYSDWGPLKFIYRYHKNRTMTLYSLALNISKYAIYLLAMGFALTELGINYTTYLASLSVIGLAIGFGSQGLVQDMVTGFFIIFEDQFNVGDMVEIPPHVGIVEELGIRMTRLRNYVGQDVVIPNRNIAAVGNYTRGALQCFLDVQASDAKAARQTEVEARSILEQIARQLQDVIITPPASEGITSLATGEHFARLRVSIWPQQQWVVDQELVPRINEGLKRKGLEIPNDKIVVFYHPREKRSVSRRGRGRNNTGQPSEERKNTEDVAVSSEARSTQT
ncbi:MAG: mechanosensitive ion channel [Phycisphaerales bacterium]|nr:MAG: mechanosensitive ion channel [Phycisphaerales bacterium]